MLLDKLLVSRSSFSFVFLFFFFPETGMFVLASPQCSRAVRRRTCFRGKLLRPVNVMKLFSVLQCCLWWLLRKLTQAASPMLEMSVHGLLLIQSRYYRGNSCGKSPESGGRCCHCLADGSSTAVTLQHSRCALTRSKLLPCGCYFFSFFVA